MISLKNIFRITEVILLIVSIFLIHSCKKDTTESDNIESDNDKYIIEMNEDFRISRVTHIVGDNVLDYDKLYNYSDNM